MASLHRIQWIDASIKLQQFPNIERIKEQFEISRRQALRDIEYLRDSLGAPLAYCPKRKGYRYTDDLFSIPGHLLTDAQAEILTCLAVHYKALANGDARVSSTFTALSDLLSRLSGRGNNSLKPISSQIHDLTPFKAVLELKSKGSYTNKLATSMKPFYRGRNEEGQEIFEFYDSRDIIPAILASGLPYSIIHPKWLKGKLLQHLENIRKIHSG
jgi:hypothetical protein